MERGDVNPDLPDTMFGQAPLSWAAERGHEGVVKKLLEQEDVNPNMADRDGRTSLVWAAVNGCEGVVKVLLERKDVNPNQADTEFGRTPLSWAAEHGREGIVKMLLTREGVNSNQADTEYGWTPLLWAAENRHERVVKILLERKDVNLDHLEDKYGQVSLPRSAGNRDERVVEMQFRGNNSTAHTLDINGLPALPSADSNGWEVVLDPKSPVSILANSDPSTKPSIRSRLPSVGVLKSRFPLKKTSTHPNITQSILSLIVDWRFISSSLICFFAFLL